MIANHTKTEIYFIRDMIQLVILRWYELIKNVTFKTTFIHYFLTNIGDMGAALFEALNPDCFPF